MVFGDAAINTGWNAKVSKVGKFKYLNKSKNLGVHRKPEMSMEEVYGGRELPVQSVVVWARNWIKKRMTSSDWYFTISIFVSLFKCIFSAIPMILL